MKSQNKFLFRPANAQDNRACTEVKKDDPLYHPKRLRIN